MSERKSESNLICIRCACVIISILFYYNFNILSRIKWNTRSRHVPHPSLTISTPPVPHKQPFSELMGSTTKYVKTTQEVVIAANINATITRPLSSKAPSVTTSPLAP